MRVWRPIEQDKCASNIIGVLLFGALVAFGLGISRMPRVVIPADAPLILLICAALIACALGFFLGLRASLKNYVRGERAFRPFLATFCIISGWFTIAFTIDRLFRSDIHIDTSAKIDWVQIPISIIGGQTAWLLFLLLFSVTRPEMSDVTAFKRLREQISSLFQDLVSDRKNYEEFSDEFRKIESKMVSLDDLAIAIAPHLERDEQAYAKAFANASKTLAKATAANPGESEKERLLTKHMRELEAIGVSARAVKGEQHAELA